jgi:hypothetical protein
MVMATTQTTRPLASSLALPGPCPECQGLRIQAQVCNNLFLLTAQPELVPAGGSHRLQALVCIACGHVTLYAKQLPCGYA